MNDFPSNITPNYEMQTPKNPLSSYDIIGYIAPGISLLFSLIYFEYFAHKFLTQKDSIIIPVFSTFDLLQTNIIDKDPGWILSLSILIIFLIISFIVGHIIASISNLIIEGILIAKGHGYPYHFLLNIEYDKYSLSSSYYRGLFVWLNVFCLLLIYDILNSLGSDTNAELNIQHKILLSYIGFFTFIKLFFTSENFDWMGNKYTFLNSDWYIKLSCYTKKLMKWLFSFPYDIFFNLITQYLKIKKRFAPWFIDKYKDAFEKNFKTPAVNAGAGNHWLPYLYVKEHSVNINHFLDNWERLYLFSRNLSGCFYIAFIYSSGWLCYHKEFIDSCNANINYLFLIPCTFLLLSAFMFTRFYFLYVANFTKLIYRTFVYINSKD